MNEINQVENIINGLIHESKNLKISFSRPMSGEKAYKSRIRKISDIKPYWQIERFIKDNNSEKVYHENIQNDLVLQKISEMLPLYKECNITTETENICVLNSKHLKIIRSKHNSNNSIIPATTHNREKNYILPAGTPVPWMISLGLTDENGNVKHDKQKKFKQINRYLEIIDDVFGMIIADRAENNKPLQIVDIGCGKSYLTFALYHYLTKYNVDFIIKGYDLKTDVVGQCNGLAKTLGFDRLYFEVKDITERFDMDHADILINLHACDTATDYALYHGMRLGCSAILAVPCCQHELNKQVSNPNLDIVLKHGILKERFSSILTDAIRAELLERNGYRCDVMEFIDMDHTPKNILLRAVKVKNKMMNEKSGLLENIITEYGINQTLYHLLQNI